MEDPKFLELTKKYMEACHRYYEKENKLFKLNEETQDRIIYIAEVTKEDLKELDDLEKQVHEAHKEWFDYIRNKIR